MSNALSRVLQGVVVGAAAMYMLDPDRGRRRRAITRDKMQRFASDSARLAHQAARDARQRLHGVNARLQQRSKSGNLNVDELRLIERVRAAMGRCVSHPHAIQAGARGATIVLSGPVLAKEVPELLAAVRAVPGVREIENHLDVHTSDDRLPSLQGEGRRRGNAPQSWTPAARLAGLVGGGVLALYGLARRNASGLMLASAGLGVAARVVSNEPLERWLLDTTRGLMRQLGAPDDEESVAPGFGSDGTPSREVGPLDARKDDAGMQGGEQAGGTDAPLLGDDGTPSTPGAQRLVMSGENQDNAPLPTPQDTSRSVH